jgi:hypothetical protein
MGIPETIQTVGRHVIQVLNARGSPASQLSLWYWHHPRIPKRRFLISIAVYVVGLLVAFFAFALQPQNEDLFWLLIAWFFGGAVVVGWFWYFAGLRDDLKGR